jgi:3-oxosteroid 1-dehydrogenase
VISEEVDRVEQRVIVVGGGLSGLATALGAAVRGRPVTVFESSDVLGGAAAYSGGQVWVGANHVAAAAGIDDDLGGAESYVRAIARAHPDLLDEQAMRRWLTTAPAAMRYWEEQGALRWTVISGLADYHAEADGALPNGRYLTCEPVDLTELGTARSRLRISPYFRMGTTYADLFAKGRRTTAASADIPTVATFGTGLVAGFLTRILAQQGVEILFSHRVTELVIDDHGRVTGVRATGPDGPVLRNGPVVLATSTYDWDPALVRQFVGLDPDDFGSLAPDTLRGDAIRLARGAGGAIKTIPASSVPMVPGWRAPVGTGFENGPEYAMPHAVIVDKTGRRFCDDSYWVEIVPKVTDPTAPHRPFFLICDEQHRRKYGLGSTPPGGDYPTGVMTSAATLPELGSALGIDGRELEKTVETFNIYALRGEDPQFGRGSIEFIRRFSGDPSHTPNPVLGPITEAPFHGLRLRLLGTGIGGSGVWTDGDGHVLDEQATAIPGLFAVGSCAAATTFGSGYNSGVALSRGLTLAYLVAQELGVSQ